VGCASHVSGTLHAGEERTFGGEPQGADMARAKRGDTVRVHYTGTLDTGEQFDSSRGMDPLSFTLGEGSVIQGFDDAVDGMAVGEAKRVTIPAAEAYGDRREELTLRVPRNELPTDLELEVGAIDKRHATTSSRSARVPR